jgi:hypothetical protein
MGWLLAAAIVLALAIAAPPIAEAQGHYHVHGGVVVHGYYPAPFYYGYPWPYYGFGWGPYYGGFYPPYAYEGYNMGAAAAAGMGAVDMNVKPGEAEVWVDGKFRGEAKHLDGSPSLLWLREGSHEIVVYKGGYKSFDERISIDPGQKLDLKVRLEKGDSQPPGQRPGAKLKTST